MMSLPRLPVFSQQRAPQFRRWRNMLLVCLALALGGYWSPWLMQPASALRLSGYDLAEWITFLPDVRGGWVSLNRLSFFIPLACLAWLLGSAAARLRGAPPAHLAHWWSGLWPRTALSWLLLLMGGLCAVMLFPPYEAYRFYWDEYQTQFVIACAVTLSLGLAWVLPEGVHDVAQLLAAVLGGGYGLWAMQQVWPLAAALLPWTLGLGWWAMLAGFVGLAWLALTHPFAPKA